MQVYRVVGLYGLVPQMVKRQKMTKYTDSTAALVWRGELHLAAVRQQSHPVGRGDNGVSVPSTPDMAVESLGACLHNLEMLGFG